MKLLKKLFSKKEEKTQTRCSLILVAAGTASRMKGVDKVFFELGDMPLFIHSLIPFQDSDLIEEIVIITRQDILAQVGHLCKVYGINKVTRVVCGGDSRTESVLKGLDEVNSKVDLVAIHDAARPFVTREVLEEAIQRASVTGAAAPGIPVKDTVKLASHGIVKETLPREQLFAIQTPQVFEINLIKGAIRKAISDEAQLTDDCSAVERIGFHVVITEGNEKNMKLTTPNDLLLAQAIFAEGRH